MEFIIEATDEVLESNGGLVLAGKILESLDLDRRFNGIRIDKMREPRITNADVIRSYFGLPALGRTAFEDIELYRNDRYFRRALGIKRVPSTETLRQRMDGSQGRFDAMIKEANARMLKVVKFSVVRTELGKYVPVDADVSPFENSKSHKEGTGRTYKGTDGYAPNFAYVGAEGYMLNCELRPGTQHCQKGTPEFLRETFDLLNHTGAENVLVRMDSGNDAAENVRLCRREGKRYLIKRVYIGSCTRFMDDGDGNAEPWRIVFEVTERTITAKGQRLLVPELEVETYWTDLREHPETVIDLYHAHGTSEQFHSELKSDMDVERLPSGKFKTNATVLHTAMMAFNALRRIGQEVLRLKDSLGVPTDVQRLRLRSVLRDIMYLACKYVERSRRYFLKFSRKSRWFFAVQCLYARL